MLRILQVEWMKVKNYRTFWILLAITLISIPAVNYMLYNIFNNSKGKSILASSFVFPDVWQTISWNSSLLFFIPAILIITLTTNEFTYKTHRQNVIDGWSRKQFVGAKLIEVFLLSVLTTITVLVTALLFGYFNNKAGAAVTGPGIGGAAGMGTGAVDGSIWRESRFVLFYFVEMLSYSLIAFVMALFVKRAGLAMGLFFIYLIVEQIIVGISWNKYHIEAATYLPEQVTDQLIPFPYAKTLISKEANWENHIPFYLLGAFIYVVIYCLATGRKFLKSDL
ncbi:MAG TPA: ABC transporter permease [Puia sp.]